MKHALTTLFVALVIAGLCVNPALALDSVTNGFWDEGATWGGVLPTGVDNIVITNGCTVTIRNNTAINIQSLTIQTNGVLTHLANTTTALGEQYKVVLAVGGDVTIDLGGEINVDEKGYAKQEGPGGPLGSFSGGSYGGKGGDRFGVASEIGPTYGSIVTPTNLGSGGARTAGGGCVQLTVAGVTTVNGIISADGEPETYYETGSGGSVFLTTGTLAGSGTIRANGGRAPNASSGGGGRLAVILTNSTNFGDVQLQAYADGGGSAGSGGTIYLEQSNHVAGQGRLVVDFNDRSHLVDTIQNELAASSYAFSEIVLTNGAVYVLDTNDTLDISSTTLYGDPADRKEGIYVDGGTLTAPVSLSWSNCFITIGSTHSTFAPTSITVGTNATLKFDVPWTLNHSLTLASGGWLSHSPNSTTAAGEQYKLNLTINGDLDIQTGGAVNVDGMGYSAGNGPGRAIGFAAAGHGGMGGSRSGTPGTTYGSITSPTNIGSGGASGAGGGAIQLTVSGTTTVNGIMSSDGDNPNYDVGSGGSVLLTTGTLAGGGTIRANGGAQAAGSSGGGGRIAVVLTNSSNFSTIDIHARGGMSGSNDGVAGTVYLRTQDQGAEKGTLVVDANNMTGLASSTTLIGSNVTDTSVGTVVLRNLAILELTNQTLTVNGSWSNAATLVAQIDSTVILASTNAATISGNTTFRDLTCTTAGKTLTFEDGKTNTVTGTLTLANATLDSTSGTSSWYLEASASMHSVSNVTVARSDARPGASIEAYDSTDEGGNFNWVFADSGFATNTWTGATDTDWSKAGNWSLNRSTIFTDAVIIPNSRPLYPLLDFDKQILSLAISNGASMSLNGYNLAVNEDVKVAGTLIVTGAETLTFSGDLDFSGGGVFNPSNSTVLLPGDVTQSVVSAGITFYQLTIGDSTGQVTFVDAVAAFRIVNQGTPLTFGGSMTVASDFRTQGTNLAFGGAVTVPAFYNENGALVFSGTVATVTFTNWQGDLTFHDDFSSQAFFCAPGGMNLMFQAGKIVTIGNLDIHGHGGNPITLRSSTDGSAWNLNVTNGVKVQQVDVRDSNATPGATIDAVASTDSGSNPNWDFGGPWQTWVGSVSEVFTNGNNWVPEGAPYTNTHLLIDGYYATAPILSGVATVAQVIVGGYTTATVTVNGTLTTLENVEVLSEGTITHSANSTTALGEQYKIELRVNGDLHIETGGQINVDSMGYSQGSGPGRPLGSYAGGSYGGKGGERFSTPSSVGPTYGSIIAPTNIGSGGARQSGGGCVQLTVTGATTMNGLISTDGEPDLNYESGSGGSVFLTTGTLAGDGTIRANGGYTASGSSGGGGRIAVILTHASNLGTIDIHARAGKSGTTHGVAGTVYLQTQSQGPDEGTLIVDANNMTGLTTTLIGSNITDTTVGTVVIRNLAILELTNQTLTVNGSWSNAATFVAKSGSTVDFASTAMATVTADNTFYNLTAGAAGKTIWFEAGKTTTVNGKLTFADNTTLLSTADGAQWWLDLSSATGNQEVGLVVVKDSNASLGQEILAGNGSTDLKNNENWSFPAKGSVFIVR